MKYFHKLKWRGKNRINHFENLLLIYWINSNVMQIKGFLAYNEIKNSI